MEPELKEFNYETGELAWWLKMVERTERVARRYGYFDLACMMQDAHAALSRIGGTRRDFRRTLIRRGRGYLPMRELQTLMDQEQRDLIARLPTPFENFVNSPSTPDDPLCVGSTSRAATDIE